MNRPFHTENLLPSTCQSYLYHMAVLFIVGKLLNSRTFLSRKKAFYKVYFDFWLSSNGQMLHPVFGPILQVKCLRRRKNKV